MRSSHNMVIGSLEVVVAVRPETIKFLSNYADTLFVGVPIVICGSSADQVGRSEFGFPIYGNMAETRAREDI